MLRRLLIRWNNALTRLRRVRVPPAGILVILPHCLQRTGCGRPVVADPSACARCGGCGIGALRDACAERGVTLGVAAGGRQALERVRAPEVRAVVAVACDKELLDGIRAAFPKPLLAIPNAQPHGPCRDTTVSLDAVTEAIDALIPLDLRR
jgi:hypothetical protein